MLDLRWIFLLLLLFASLRRAWPNSDQILVEIAETRVIPAYALVALRDYLGFVCRT